MPDKESSRFTPVSSDRRLTAWPASDYDHIVDLCADSAMQVSFPPFLARICVVPLPTYPATNGSPCARHGTYPDRSECHCIASLRNIAASTPAEFAAILCSVSISRLTFCAVGLLLGRRIDEISHHRSCPETGQGTILDCRTELSVGRLQNWRCVTDMRDSLQHHYRIIVGPGYFADAIKSVFQVVQQLRHSAASKGRPRNLPPSAG